MVTTRVDFELRHYLVGDRSLRVAQGAWTREEVTLSYANVQNIEVNQGPLAVNDKVFSAIGLLALANGALINMIMASRLLYGMAEEGVMPRQLGTIHGGRRTPWVAILFTTAIAAVLVITADLEKLADTTVALLVIVFAIVNATVLYLRRDPVDHDHFRVPSVVPVIGIGLSIALLTQIEGEIFARAGILVGVGLVLWIINALLVRAQPD